MISHISKSALNKWLLCGESYRRHYIDGNGYPQGSPHAGERLFTRPRKSIISRRS